MKIIGLMMIEVGKKKGEHILNIGGIIRGLM